MSTKTKQDIRQRLHDRIRKKIRGTPARPRLAVYRSQGHIYAQVIDDDASRTLVAASSLDKDLRAKSKRGGMCPGVCMSSMILMPPTKPTHASATAILRCIRRSR